MSSRYVANGWEFCMDPIRIVEHCRIHYFPKNTISIPLLPLFCFVWKSPKMNSMNINTEYSPVKFDDGHDGHGHPKESMFIRALKGRQYRSLYCIGWTAFCMISAYSITSIFSLFSVNSLFSIASVNSWFSLWSVNRWMTFLLFLLIITIQAL